MTLSEKVFIWISYKYKTKALLPDVQNIIYCHFLLGMFCCRTDKQHWQNRGSVHIPHQEFVLHFSSTKLHPHFAWNTANYWGLEFPVLSSLCFFMLAVKINNSIRFHEDFLWLNLLLKNISFSKMRWDKIGAYQCIFRLFVC